MDELGEEVDDNKDEEDGDEGGGLTVVENDFLDEGGLDESAGGGDLDESGGGGLDRCEVDEDLVEDERRLSIQTPRASSPESYPSDE
jgi:hypothetical protein